MRLTVLHLDSLKQLSDAEVHILCINRDMAEYEVVPLLAYLRLADDKTRSFFLDTGLAFTPLSRWVEHKEMFDTLRLQAGMHESDAFLQWVSTSLRKVMTLTGRKMQPADFEQEEKRSLYTYADRAKMLTPAEYAHLFVLTANQLISELMARLRTQGLETCEEWWATRGVSTPSGSSSWRHVLQDKLRDTQLVESASRPNKMTVYSHLPKNTMRHILRHTPKIHGRASTKYEPGNKQRALYAADDAHSIIASYASRGMEEAMRFDGMVAKQTPQDVVHWDNWHEQSRTVGGWWLSLDYSDFNKEHRWWEQSIINVLMAEHWDDMPLGPAAQHKAAATWWVAESYTRRTASINNSVRLIPNGLFSGERNTARDNTLLHNIYKRMMLTLLSLVHPTCPAPLYITMCGDDEDGLHATQDAAIKYYAVGAAVGWHFNPVKQLLSRHKHEFLQVEAHGSALPSQPLISTVVAFIHGNWYQQSQQDIVTTADAMYSVGANIIARGGDTHQTELMIHKATDNFYRFTYKEKVRWDSLLNDGLVDRYLMRPQGAASPPVVDTQVDDSRYTRLVRSNLTLRTIPAIVELTHQNWDVLQTIPEGVRAQAIDAVALLTQNKWFEKARCRLTTLPQLQSGITPIYRYVASTITPERSLLLKALELDHSPHMTRLQAAASIGMPAELLKYTNALEIYKKGSTRVQSLLFAVDEEEENPLKKTLLKHTLPNVSWA